MNYRVEKDLQGKPGILFCVQKSGLPCDLKFSSVKSASAIEGGGTYVNLGDTGHAINLDYDLFTKLRRAYIDSVQPKKVTQ